jgi:hypothetical protein
MLTSILLIFNRYINTPIKVTQNGEKNNKPERKLALAFLYFFKSQHSFSVENQPVFLKRKRFYF